MFGWSRQLGPTDRGPDIARAVEGPWATDLGKLALRNHGPASIVACQRDGTSGLP